ncbi:HNH endonuclease [Enterococcus casseliflavus]|nr:HNH endonuclease [Enterococcus casseliflavus]WBY90949.1 HNH endonuclease [Enterococcus casseliflavus]
MAKYSEWITEEGLTRIEGWAIDGLADKQIAENIGVAYSTFREWVKKFPALSASLKKSKDVVDRQVENALFKRAIGYEYTEVTKERIVDTGQKKRHEGQSELTQEEWEMAKAYFRFHCAYCGQEDELTKDHLDPLNNKGSLTVSNVVPACRSCNSSKKDHQWLAWFQKRKFYNRDRARKITDYIDFVLSMPSKPDINKDTSLVITKEVTKQVAPDTGAAAFWLKNRKPDVWRDKKETELSGNVSVSNPFADLTTEELRKLARDEDG